MAKEKKECRYCPAQIEKEIYDVICFLAKYKGINIKDLVSEKLRNDQEIQDFKSRIENLRTFKK